MHVIVVGCGRVGARVALELSAEHRVTVVDRRSSAFDRLPPDFAGETVLGNGIDVDVLRTAGVVGADVFLALTDVDNSNLMAAQVADQLGAKLSVARVYDAERCETFTQMGLKTVSPTVRGAERLRRLVLGIEEE